MRRFIDRMVEKITRNANLMETLLAILLTLTMGGLALGRMLGVL